MEHFELQTKIKMMLAEQLMISDSEITENANMFHDLGMDSLDSIEFIMQLEEEFGIEIPDEITEKIETFSDAFKYVENKIKEKEKNEN